MIEQVDAKKYFVGISWKSASKLKVLILEVFR